MTLAQALAEATQRLTPHSDDARLEAEALWAHLLGIGRAALYARLQDAIPPAQFAAFRGLLSRRTGGEPLPYILGGWEFYGLQLALDSRALIPRPETETLVEAALDLLLCRASPPSTKLRTSQPHPVVVDVGTGSGAVAIALAISHPHARLYATDVSTQALELAQTNATSHQAASRIQFLAGDLLAPLPEPADLVVANPPYVMSAEVDRWQTEGKLFEPRAALDGGPDGLEVLRRLLEQAPAKLRPNGALLAEIGSDQGVRAKEAAQRRFPRARVCLLPDLAGRDRVIQIETLN